MIRSAAPADLPAVEALLASFELPTSGVADHIENFLVAEDGGRIVASAGIELYGASALLRSVAVHPDYRRRGLARHLIDGLLRRAHVGGVHDVYLLTSTASAYFAQLGFAAIPDSAIDPAVRASAEFDSCCCVGAQAMHLTFGQAEGATR